MHDRQRCGIVGLRRGGSLLGLLLLATAAAGSLYAADDDDTPAGFTAISPIFGQLVAFTQPPGFVPVFEEPTANRYIREAVPKGETVENWTQMITITGVKGAAADPEASPEGFASAIVDGFKRTCPQTFATAVLSEDQIDGHDAYAVVASCGSVGTEGAAHSETALIVAIEGAEDYYTIQWAERSEAAAEPLDIDDDAWRQRFEQLSPIRLCPIVPGESAPFPSCVAAD
ncbi:hypothetical protein [Hyphomicrobium sp.]|uniref:hypothetical protein n=1 Tax=Hyphomicrobium sp. TaxID=82 RepID=UPI003F70188C